MLEIFQEYFLSYGYYFLFLGSLLEGVVFTGFFVPGGLIVLLGAYFSRFHPGEISFWYVLLLSWSGMFVGDMINYYLGKNVWQRYFSKIRFFDRLARVHVFGEEKKIEKILEKWGLWAILYSHVVGALRSVIGFVAGASGYPLKRYIWATLVASFLWSFIYTGVGYFVAEATSDFRKINTTITISAIGILLLLLFLRFAASIIITFFTSRYVARRVLQARLVKAVGGGGRVFAIVKSIFQKIRK